MYGKHFESMYEGSMYGAGLAVFAVWGYVIAHMRKGNVELNPQKLSDTLGGTVEEVKSAIDTLCAPDPGSRHKEHEGRRLLKRGRYEYFAPTWEIYRKIRNEEERREYNRIKQAEYRSMKERKSVNKARGKPLPGEAAHARALSEGRESDAEHLDDNQPGLPSANGRAPREEPRQAGGFTGPLPPEPVIGSVYREAFIASELSLRAWILTPNGQKYAAAVEALK